MLTMAPVKILDFGLARRLRPEEASFDPPSPCWREMLRSPPPTPRAAEPFATWPRSSLSRPIERAVDVWRLASSFMSCEWPPSLRSPDDEDFQAIRAIQFLESTDLSVIIPEISAS